jgi:cytochrome c553
MVTTMRNVCAAVLAFGLLSAAIVSTQQPSAAPAKDLSWAFPVKNGDLTPEPEGPKQIPGSTKTYTTKEIDDLSNAVDWFPNDHPPAPSIVLKGHGDALACGVCHLMNGAGHPESASLAGLNAEYMKRQMADFKSGVRNEPNRMNKIAQALSEEEIDQAAEWFAKLPPVAGWTKVTEASTVAKTFVGGGRMRFALPGGGTEPIGTRIITLPQDTSRAIKRDIHSGFVAHVPTGSIKRGETLVKTGGAGKTLPCGTCHGDALQGLGSIPRLAGLHPIYIARQLYSFKDGNRHGLESALMKKPVEKLTDADIVAIAAYLGGLN